MSFNEAIKKEVRRKAHYLCCICKEPFIDVHHIIPEGQEGKDNIENAAPLCSKCHRNYGNNPDHRKTIREMRDLWYEICENRYKDDSSQPIFEKLDQLGQVIKLLRNDKANERRLLAEIKDQFKQLKKEEEREINTATSLEELGSKNMTATKLGDRIYSNVHCKKCNTTIGLSVGSDRCPNCGMPYEL